MNISRIKKLLLALKSLPCLVVVIIVGLNSTSCANSTNGNFSSDSLYKENDKYLSFYEKEDGNNIHWEINFENEEIASVYRDGEKISSEEVEEYRAMINEKLDEIRFGLTKHSFKMDHFTFDMDEFHADMEIFNEQMRNHSEYLDDFVFDDEKFDLKFDSGKFKEQMEKLNEQFKGHQFNFEFDFDMDELEETLEAHRFNLDDIDIDLEDLDIQMEELDEVLEELDINMEDLDEEMEKFDDFIDELRKELVVNGYIDNENEDVEIKLSAKEMFINGKKLPGELLDKYKNIYKKHMGKDMSETSNIHIH